MAKLYVVIGADTEDNAPSYTPNWSEYGSNYDVNPANFKWHWTKYWDNVIEIFRENDFPVTWYIRVDECIKDELLKNLKGKILELKNAGDEIGIHIHTLEWDGSIWRQSRNEKKEKEIVDFSIKTFKKVMGFYPKSCRMGWNAMDNSIMNALEDNGILYECSAVPHYYSRGMYGGRDNIADWSNVGSEPYHPSSDNYQCEGNMKIIECPISSLGKKSLIFSESGIIRLINRSLWRVSIHFIPLIEKMGKFFNISPHTNFIISPIWPISNVEKIVDRYIKLSKRNGLAIIHGYFHPYDIFNPKKGSLNEDFADKIRYVLEYIKSKDNDVEIIPSTISNAMESYLR